MQTTIEKNADATQVYNAERTGQMIHTTSDHQPRQSDGPSSFMIKLTYLIAP
jgi:hypothetical protein